MARDALTELRARMAAGKRVTAADLAAADAADRLAVMQDEIDAEAAAIDAEAARAARVEEILDGLAAFVDDELDAIRSLWDDVNASLDRLDEQVMDLQENVRRSVHELSQLGVLLGPDGDLHTRTAGRVLYDRLQLFAQTSTRKLPMSLEAWQWLDNRRGERDAS